MWAFEFFVLSMVAKANLRIQIDVSSSSSQNTDAVSSSTRYGAHLSGERHIPIVVVNGFVGPCPYERTKNGNSRRSRDFYRRFESQYTLYQALPKHYPDFAGCLSGSMHDLPLSTACIWQQWIPPRRRRRRLSPSACVCLQYEERRTSL